MSKETFIAEQLTTFKERAEKKFPGLSYAAFYSHEHDEVLWAPPGLILSSPFSHAVDYGSGIFEGGSAMINERTGIPHILLLEARTDRMFDRSIPSRGYMSPIPRETFSQTILDIVAVNGFDLFKDPKGGEAWVRGYVRPTIHPAPLEGYGVSLRKDYLIDAEVIAWAWPDYLSPRVYTDGMVAAITGHQRLFPILGKHASNYGAAGTEGMVARSLGADELIYLAPYLIDEHGHEYWADPKNQEAKIRHGVLADGPGEEVFAITKDGKTLVYPPMRVNRLGGTVLHYVVAHMAPALGFETKECNITIADLRSGEYEAVGMMGNAVKIAPVREIQLLSGESLVEQISFYPKGHIPESFHMLMQQYDLETRGLIDPSHPSLVTPVDMERGKMLREQLDQFFQR